MTFIWPVLLAALALIPVFAVLYIIAQRRRRTIAGKYGSLAMLQRAPGKAMGLRRHVPPMLLTAGLTLAILALARPQAAVSLPRLEGTVVLAFDVSGSMAATDMEPTRMEAAKTAARAFVERQPQTVRVGIVAFSDSGMQVQTPTNNKETLITAIKRLEPGRGTSLANGILAALRSIEVARTGPRTRYYNNSTPEPTPSPTPVPKGTFASASIVLLTDGENTQNPDPMAAVQEAIDRGVRIHTVGVGSPGGVPLTLDGFTVQTRLDESMLQAISAMTEGAYFNARTGEDLRAIYDRLDMELLVRPEDMEVTSIFAGASIVILLIGGVLSMLWFGRVP